MQNYVGQQIDRYRIIERLGMGGMAVVYKAFDTRLERDVALKLIRVDEIPASQHERLMKRFEREAKAMAKFSHPNIVPVYDYGEVDGSPYLVMEYIPGGTLKDKTGKPVPVETALSWIAPIADALTYAHESGIVHRDVKPSNILFDQKGRPILTDFGIAKVLETGETNLTGTGLGVGTPEYMAPEQWRGKASEATDQYSLGIVLYELLTGQKPYKADTPAALVILQATEPLPQPSRLVEGMPEALEKFLYKALALDPQDRYVDMERFQETLVGLSARIHKDDLQENFSTEEKVLPDDSTISEDKTFDEFKYSHQDESVSKVHENAPAKRENRKKAASVHKKKSRRLLAFILIMSSLIVLFICSVIYFIPASWWCDLTGDALASCKADNNVQETITSDASEEIVNIIPELQTEEIYPTSTSTKMANTATEKVTYTPTMEQIISEVRESGVYLRGGPSVYHQIISDHLEKGTKVIILSKEPKGEWFLVQTEGLEGWLYKEWIEMNFDVTLIPIESQIPTPPPPTPAPAPVKPQYP
jgi:serine/threonine protein kinase